MHAWLRIYLIPTRYRAGWKPPLLGARKKNEGSRRTPLAGTELLRTYFFLAFALLDDALLFFEDDLAAAFFVAIVFTTFHAVRDLTVAPSWQITPDFSDELLNGVEAATARRPLLPAPASCFVTVIFTLTISFTCNMCSKIINVKCSDKKESFFRND